ncbi:hypothetical protein C2845_PM01G44920 [Panicum miliaceum]|uniref:Uncharacterized protein n=1 Tax=Panicum miliaceum TaxID=4540 RepID=A0A3L6TPR6_PANMI|nr:hypothetical protein C2845_PM01G44920 [Panicum miliaceum]
MEPEASSCSSGLVEFNDSLDKMQPYLPTKIEENSVPDAFLTHAPTRLSSSGPTQSKDGRTRLPFELRNAPSTYAEALQSKSLSDLEEDLDLLLKLGDKDATSCREAPVFDAYSDSDDELDSSAFSHLGLSITTTVLGRFVYWKGMEASELLDDDARLVATIQELPFQKGRPLLPIQEETSRTTTSTLIITDYSGDYSSERKIYMASVHDLGDNVPDIKFDNEPEDEISANQDTASAPQNETEEQRRIRKWKNARRAKRRRNAEERACNPQWRRNLRGEFEAATDEELFTPMGNIYEASLLLQQIPQTDNSADHAASQATAVQLDKMGLLK